MGAWRSGIEREKDSGTAVLWAYHEISWFRLGVIGFVIRMLHVVIIFKCSKQILGFWYQRIYLRQHTRHTNSELWFIAAKSWIAVDVPASTIEPSHTNYNKYFLLRSHTNSYNTLFIWVWGRFYMRQGGKYYSFEPSVASISVSHPGLNSNFSFFYVKI